MLEDYAWETKRDAIAEQQVMKILHRKNWMTFDRGFAYGTPTYETNKGSSSVVDVVLVSEARLQPWMDTKVAITHEVTQHTHHSMIAESSIPITINHHHFTPNAPLTMITQTHID